MIFITIKTKRNIILQKITKQDQETVKELSLPSTKRIPNTSVVLHR